jgi:hypothetical protein
VHRSGGVSPMEEGARVHHSYGSYAPLSYGSYEPRRANPSTDSRGGMGLQFSSPVISSTGVS